MANKNKNNTKRSGKRGGRNSTSGDVPAPAIRTYRTVSCPIPRVSDSCLVHATGSTTITVTPTAALAQSYNFQLSSSNINSGFFDQYRIAAIRFTIAPQNNAVGLVTNSTTQLVPLYCVIDYDDSTNLSSAASAQGYTSCVVLNPGESLERVFKPRIAVGAYTGAFSGFANMSDQWIDAVSTNVQHYGVKVYASGVLVGQTLLQSWDINIEYFVEFRKAI